MTDRFHFYFSRLIAAERSEPALVNREACACGVFMIERPLQPDWCQARTPAGTADLVT